MRVDVQDALHALISRVTPAIRRLHVAWYGGGPLIRRDLVFSLSDRIITHCDAHGLAYDRDHHDGPAHHHRRGQRERDPRGHRRRQRHHRPGLTAGGRVGVHDRGSIPAGGEEGGARERRGP